MQNSARFWEGLGALLALGLGTATWVLSSGLPRPESGLGPDLFPRVLAAVLVVSGAGILLVRKGKPGSGLPLPKTVLLDLLRVTLLLLTLALAPWLLTRVGLVPTATLFTVLASLFMGARWKEVLLAGAIIWAVGYVVFVRLLGV